VQGAVVSKSLLLYFSFIPFEEGILTTEDTESTEKKKKWAFDLVSFNP